MNNIKDLIKGKSAIFDAYKDGKLYYIIECEEFSLGFAINIQDISPGMTLFTKHRAISLLKFINKSIEENTLTKMF